MTQAVIRPPLIQASTLPNAIATRRSMCARMKRLDQVSAPALLNGHWPFRGCHARTRCRPPQQAIRPLLPRLTPQG